MKEDGDRSSFSEFCDNDAVNIWCQDNRQWGAAREAYPHLPEAPDDWIDMYRLGLLRPLIRMESGSHSAVLAELYDYGKKALEWFAWIELFRTLVHDTSKAARKTTTWRLSRRSLWSGRRRSCPYSCFGYTKTKLRWA